MSRAFAWIEGTNQGVPFNHEMYQLGALAGGYGQTEARAISHDGRYAVGYSDAAGKTGLAVRWNLDGLASGGGSAAQSLGSLTGALGNSTANAVSADGSIVVGYSADADGRDRAFRWKEGATNGVVDNPEMLDMGTLGGHESWARGITRDGVWAVGTSTTETDHEIAFRWSEETGMESIGDWLARHDVEIGDQWLATATSISDDGRIVGGRMVYLDENGNEQWRAYLARVVAEEPPPGEEP
ncbi:MAG: hypothetical protein GX970_07070, partial [Phyllobacteriaceae bacterium]|nr:hypothetical protein [Phyllobacteriaceae bacterium]